MIAGCGKLGNPNCAAAGVAAAARISSPTNTRFRIMPAPKPRRVAETGYSKQPIATILLHLPEPPKASCPASLDRFAPVTPSTSLDKMAG
jgi:hypothetical protein